MADGKNSQCKTCRRAYVLNNKEKIAKGIWLYKLKTKFGINEDDYNQLLLKQNHCCAICGFDDKRLVIDHDHLTGVVRGLLCNHCNVGIGNLADSVEILEKAITYLRNN